MNALPEQLWTIEDVATFLRVKPSVVKYWVKGREIPHIRQGNVIWFDPVDIRKWLESKKKRVVFDKNIMI